MKTARVCTATLEGRSMLGDRKTGLFVTLFASRDKGYRRYEGAGSFGFTNANSDVCVCLCACASKSS